MLALKGQARRAFDRISAYVDELDRVRIDEEKAIVLKSESMRVIEFFAGLNEGRYKTDEFLQAVKTLGECVRALNLDDFIDDIADIGRTLVRILPRADGDLARAIIGCLLAFSYQEDEPFLYNVSENVYKDVTNFILSGQWKTEFARDLYMALYRMARKSLRIRNAILFYKFMPIDRLAELITESPDHVFEQCYLLYGLTSQRLSPGDARTCVKLIHFLFERAEERVLETVVYSMFNVIRKCTEVPSCFYSDDTLNLMISRAGGDGVISEYILYVIQGVIAKPNHTQLNLSMDKVVPFLRSSNPKCQLASAFCLRTVVTCKRDMIPMEGVQQILSIIEEQYFDATVDVKNQLNKLIIVLFKTYFDERSALDIIFSGYKRVIVEMLHPICTKGTSSVLMFYRDILEASAKTSVASDMWDLFEDGGAFDNMKELLVVSEASGNDPKARRLAIAETVENMLSLYGTRPTS